MAQPRQEQTNINQEQGLLPHEARFVLNALEKALAADRKAAQEYGEAVNNSGGDWVFDDGASAASAEEAHRRGHDVKVLQGLSYLAKHVDALPYPDPTSTTAQIGSRVTAKVGKYVDVFDITSRYIPGMEPQAEVELLSPESPMGQAFLDAEAGSTVHWSAVDRRNITAEILIIDQTAQALYNASE